MPAPVSSSPTPATSKAASGRPQVNSRSKKTRIVRRRGRAKDAIESEDEIEREVGTDSDSDSNSDDNHSSLHSDSDTKSVSHHALPNGHSLLSTPSTTQSAEEHTSVHDDGPSKHAVPETPFFGATGNWSEMVADETANGPADLPVINFSDLDQHIVSQRPQPTPRSRRKPKPAKKPPVARPASETTPGPVPSAPLSPTGDRTEPENNRQVASSSRQSSRSYTPWREPGQSARQAYQQRLETDPSYVPTVGDFWGHDDRLLDKDLRSLSGWWRGRWQGRGRSLSFYRGFPGRGRGKIMLPSYRDSPPSSQDTPENSGKDAVQPTPPEMAPIEQAWSHDGFEEMKRKEDHRRPQEIPQPGPSRGLGSFRGRSFGRGRGGFIRGGFASPPTKSRLALPFSGKTWFAKKPERVWTKQHDAFLYLDPALKPRPGQGPIFRVKLPGDRPQIIRTSLKNFPQIIPGVTKPSTPSVFGSEDGEKALVVRIPKRGSRRKTPEQPPSSLRPPLLQEESVRTREDLPIDDAFVVRPRFGEKPAPDSTAPAVNSASTTSLLPASVSLPAPSRQAGSTSPSIPPDPKVQQQLEKLSIEPSNVDPTHSLRWAQTEEAVLRNPPTETRTDNHAQPHPTLPPLQTVFSPISQGPPSFGSHFAYGHSLPPGIAVNQHGMPYELATGRAVYLQPPPAMYNPRPMVNTHMPPPSMPFVPGHMHHHSTVSPDFLSQPSSQTPPINGFVDPSSGSPIFSLPRSSRAVEIRAPTEQPDKSSNTSFARRPSGLRSSSSASEPSSSTGGNGSQNYFLDANGSMLFAVEQNQEGSSEEGRVVQQPPMDSAVMPYPLYQHHYYYPEAYGYAPYMDMSQVAPYEMYPQDPRTASQAVYY